MRVIWNGRDITEFCNITECVHRDAAGGKNDTIEVAFDRAETWYRWGPEEGDRIEITEGEYRTGEMYLTAVIPTRNRFRLLAGSMKPESKRKVWEGFEDVSWKALVERCAAEIGMNGRVFGMEDKLMIPYALRKDETCAEFLTRIGRTEGFRMKAYNGALRAIYLPWAEGMEAEIGITLNARTEGVQYRKRQNHRLARLTVQSPWVTVTARDTAAAGGHQKTVTGLPAKDPVQAGRWARNLLREHNRTAEEITLEQKLNLSIGALTRIHIAGDTDMNGEWIAEEVEHDLKNRTTKSKLYRVINTIR